MAKKIGNLIVEETITLEFCKEAIIEAARHKHHRKSVRKVLSHIEDRAKELRDMVLNETFVPSQYTYKTKLEYGKVRKLLIPKFFPDQCIHHVLIMLVRGRILKRIDPHAIASIPNRGQIMAVRLVRRWKKTKYIIKGDIKKCFDSIKPNVIIDTYRKFIKDKKYLRLKSLVAYSTPSLPLGNYCSAYDLNLLLKPMDDYIRSHKFVKHYIRYMDDFVIFVTNWRKGKALREGISLRLFNMGLRLKENYQMFRFVDRGLDFVGYRFFKDYTILRKRNLYNLYKKECNAISLKKAQSIISSLGFASHCFSSKVRKIFNKKQLINIIRRGGNNWRTHLCNLPQIGLA